MSEAVEVEEKYTRTNHERIEAAIKSFPSNKTATIEEVINALVFQGMSESDAKILAQSTQERINFG